MTSKMSAITGFGNHIVFAMIHCTTKVMNFIFVIVMVFFVFDLVIVSINPYTTFQTTFWPDLIMPLYHIFLIKVHTLGNHYVKNNEEINARVY